MVNSPSALYDIRIFLAQLFHQVQILFKRPVSGRMHCRGPKPIFGRCPEGLYVPEVWRVQATNPVGTIKLKLPQGEVQGLARIGLTHASSGERRLTVNLEGGGQPDHPQLVISRPPHVLAGATLQAEQAAERGFRVRIQAHRL